MSMKSLVSGLLILNSMDTISNHQTLFMKSHYQSKRKKSMAGDLMSICNREIGLEMPVIFSYVCAMSVKKVISFAFFVLFFISSRCTLAQQTY